MFSPEGSDPIEIEEQRQQEIKEIEKKLDLLTTQQNEALDREDSDKVDEIQLEIDATKCELHDVMNDKERITVFESKLDDHREMAEMGLPVTITTIAIDAWGSTLYSESPYMLEQLRRIQQENDFIESEE